MGLVVCGANNSQSSVGRASTVSLQTLNFNALSLQWVETDYSTQWCFDNFIQHRCVQILIICTFATHLFEGRSTTDLCMFWSDETERNGSYTHTPLLGGITILLVFWVNYQ